MIVAIIMILIGFFLLIKGADFLVDSASEIAKKFHIPEIIIGLTIVSIGTSMPELLVSMVSAKDGLSDISIGNVIGSNISNLLLILGLSTVIKSIEFKKQTKLIEIPICFCVTALFIFVCNIGADVNRVDAGVLLFAFVLFLIYTIVAALKSRDDEQNNQSEDKSNDRKKSMLRNLFFLILGIVSLKIGGDLTVNNAVKIANFFNLSEKIISVTIIAIGTSLPELVTSVSAAIKGKSDIAIGNIIGSNIFNMLLIIGVTALIKPITYNLAYNYDLIILTIATVLLLIFPLVPPKNKMSRSNGLVYLILYVIYVISIINM